MTEQPTNNNTNAGNTALVSNKTYDILKPLASLWFPLLLAFYGTLSQVWMWPLEVQIMATLGAVQVLLGGLLAAASASYRNSEAKYDGDLKVTHEGAIVGVAANTGFVPTGAKDAVFKITTVPDPAL